jgi:hypothetical protein
MEALVTCRCRHSIILHEGSGCAAPRCSCSLTGHTVLDSEIERLKVERRLSRPDGAPAPDCAKVKSGRRNEGHREWAK